MIQRRLFFSFFCFAMLLSLTVSGQSIRDFFLRLPASQCPYLNTNQRENLIDKFMSNDSSGVKNALEGQSRITQLTANFIEVSLSSSSIMQVKRFQTADSLAYFALVKTILMPQKQSVLVIYDEMINEVEIHSLTDIYNEMLTDYAQTMSQSDLLTIKNSLYPYLFFVSLNSTDDRLTLVPQVSFPMFTEENSDEMSLQRILPLAELLKN